MRQWSAASPQHEGRGRPIPPADLMAQAHAPGMTFRMRALLGALVLVAAFA